MSHLAIFIFYVWIRDPLRDVECTYLAKTSNFYSLTQHLHLGQGVLKAEVKEDDNVGLYMCSARKTLEEHNSHCAGFLVRTETAVDYASPGDIQSEEILNIRTRYR